mgnify:CR=1 FL=1
MTVSLDRRKLLRVVKELPESCSLEDAVYRIHLWAAIEEAETDVAAGRVQPQDAVEQRLRSKWQRQRR